VADTAQDFEQIVTAAAEREAPETGPEGASPDLGIDLEEYRLQFQLGCLDAQLRQLNDNHRLRLAYTGKIFCLVVGWLVAVISSIALSGFSRSGFRLSDSVIIAFITSTTVNVVGLFVIVAKWMYPSGSHSDSAGTLEKRAGDLRHGQDSTATQR
jgi:hypothetical protein